MVGFQEYKELNPYNTAGRFEADLKYYIALTESGPIIKDRFNNLKVMVNSTFLIYLKEHNNLRFVEVTKDKNGILGYYSYMGVRLNEVDSADFYEDRCWYSISTCF